jgi:hypothetical protein
MYDTVLHRVISGAHSIITGVTIIRMATMSVDDDVFWYVEDGRIEFEWGSSGSTAARISGISNIKLQVFHKEISS